MPAPSRATSGLLRATVTLLMGGALAQLVPNRAAQKELRDLAFTAMDALRGILLSSFVDRDSERAQKRWKRVCGQLRGMFVDALDGSAVTAETSS